MATAKVFVSEPIFISLGNPTSMGEYALKVTTINGKSLTGDIILTKSDLGLSEVDNTSDMDKPISTAVAEALAGIGSGGGEALAQEIEDRTVADNELFDAISLEEETRSTADSTLQNNLNIEISARTQADIEHLEDFQHEDIEHDNREALDAVVGLNTGDQDLSEFATFNGEETLTNKTVDKLQFATTTPVLTGEGQVGWNGNEYTINIETGLGATIQVGQETLVLYYNNTGSTIINGQVLHPSSVVTVDDTVIPTMVLADASDWKKCQSNIIFATHDVLDGEIALGTRFGRVRGLDTSTCVEGSRLYLSATTPGAVTTTSPAFPNYSISVGRCLKSDATEGDIMVSVTTRIQDTVLDAFDGSIRETFDFRVTSDGTTITGTLNNITPANPLTLIMSDGFYTFAAGQTISLTPGTSTNPQSNYIYIPKDTKVLTVSTTEFPEVEHCKVAYVELFDAAHVATDGALVNQNINDHIKKEDDNGHILHMAERIRVSGAEWDSGVAPTLTTDGTDVFLSTTSGKVWQMHKQVFPTQNMATGDNIHIVNDFTTPYRSTTNLNTILSYSDGNSNNNNWFSVVVWGIANKSGEPSHLMLNLPSDGYNSEDDAIADRNNFSDYSIPKKLKSTGFLIGRYTMRRSSTTFTYNGGDAYFDLRGFVGNSTAGSGAGGSGVTDFTQLSDTPSAYTGESNKLLKVNNGETALEYTNVTVDDLDNVIIPGNVTINGTLTTINTDTLQVKDKNIELGYIVGGGETDTTADGGGITLKGATDKTITWVKSKLSWVFNQAVEIAGNLNVIGIIKTNGSQISTSDLSDGSNLVKNTGTSTDNAITRFNSTTGKVVQNSPSTLDDDGNIAGLKDTSTETVTIDSAVQMSYDSVNEELKFTFL